jgi:restriction endonuclease S subunit
MTSKLNLNNNLFNMGSESKGRPNSKSEMNDIIDVKRDSKNKSVNENVSVDKTRIDKQVSKQVDLQGVNEYVNKNVYNIEGDSTPTDTSVSLSFSRKPRRRKPVPMTYRLYPETIEKIDELAMKSGMYVSEFLQTVLDRVLDEIKIE